MSVQLSSVSEHLQMLCSAFNRLIGNSQSTQIVTVNFSFETHIYYIENISQQHQSSFWLSKVAPRFSSVSQ